MKLGIKKKYYNKVFAACGLILFSCFSQAALVTQMGDDVNFTYDDSSLYGAGTVIGNNIFFNPTAFIANSQNSEGAVNTNATLNITVAVSGGPDARISGFHIAESGDYLLSGNGNGNVNDRYADRYAGRYSEPHFEKHFEHFEKHFDKYSAIGKVNGGSVSASADAWLSVISQTTLCGLMPCKDTGIFSAGDLTTRGALTEWGLEGMIDLASVTGWGADTQVLAQIQNVLTATSLRHGSSAFVQKKFVGIGVQVVPSFPGEVPIPAAAWLFGSALVGLVGLRRLRV